MRLIDADALKEAMCMSCSQQACDGGRAGSIQECYTIQVIDEQPTVEIPSADYPCMTCIHHCINNLNYKPKATKAKSERR